MKRYLSLFFLYLFICKIIFGGELLHAQQIQELSYELSNSWLVIKLPYKLKMNTANVFSEDTKLAIKILEIKVDGKNIFLEPDPVLYNYRPYPPKPTMKIINVNMNKDIYYIRMSWSFHEETSDNINFYKSLSWGGGYPNYQHYKIGQESKELIIRYKVIIPFKSVTAQNLLDGNIPITSYSEEYYARIDLTNAFR